MIEQFACSHGNILGFALTGPMREEDYRALAAIVDTAIGNHGKIRLLLQFGAFPAWSLRSLWGDIRFTAQYSAKIERFALVGSSRVDESIAKLGSPFVPTEVRYFDTSELEVAWSWLEEGNEPARPKTGTLMPIPEPTLAAY